MAEGRVSPRSRFFHGSYDSYCYLPLCTFCGRHLLAAKLRPANIDAAGAREELARIISQIRARWPRVCILLRGQWNDQKAGRCAVSTDRVCTVRPLPA